MKKYVIDPNPIRVLVSENIKRYRIMRAMTQQELADRCNLSHEYIRRIETDKSRRFCTIQTIYEISVALGINITQLLVDEFEKEYD